MKKRDPKYIAQQRYEMFKEICKEFEEKYAINSDAFIDKFSLDKNVISSLGDTFDWYAAKAGMDIWHIRLKEEIFKSRYRLEMFQEICHNFEKKFNIDSNRFLKGFEAGEFPQKAEFFEWYASKIAVNQMGNFLGQVNDRSI